MLDPTETFLELQRVNDYTVAALICTIAWLSITMAFIIWKEIEPTPTQIIAYSIFTLIALTLAKTGIAISSDLVDDGTPLLSAGVAIFLTVNSVYWLLTSSLDNSYRLRLWLLYVTISGIMMAGGVLLNLP